MKKGKNKAKWIVLFISIVIVGIATILLNVFVFNSQPKKKEEKIEVQTVTTEEEKAELEQRDRLVESHIRMITGSQYLKDFEIKDTEVSLTFVKDFKEFKKHVDATNITEEMYKSFWKQKGRIEMMFMEEPMMLFKEFSHLEKVNMTIPNGNKLYQMSIKRKAAKEFYGLPFPQDKNDPIWKEKFYSKVFDPQQSKKYMEQFVVIKKVN